MFCTSCGTENPESLRFCIECGFALSLEPAGEPQEDPVQQPSARPEPEGTWVYREPPVLEPPPDYHSEPGYESSVAPVGHAEPYRAAAVLEPAPTSAEYDFHEPTMFQPPAPPQADTYQESAMFQPPPDPLADVHHEPILSQQQPDPTAEAHHEPTMLQPPPAVPPVDLHHERTMFQPPPDPNVEPPHQPTIMQPPPTPGLDAYHEPTMLQPPPGAPPPILPPPPVSTPKRTKVPRYIHKVGERIGVYTLEEPMGTGAFAEVWKALETTANRPVALKIFYDRVMVNPDQARVFRMEAQKQAQLEHERVTPIYYCHLDPENGGLPCYIAMKLMPGGTLEDVLKAKGRIPQEEALTIIRDVLEGLDAAHATGIIHRDIKPRNVLFDKHGRATLADFGIAKDLKAASQTVAGTVMGTPTYMSPEQALGLTITQGSDIYSVGIMLYEMLAGQPPYTGKNVTEILVAHQHGNPRKLSEFVPGISPQVERIVYTCMEQEVNQRYSDCNSIIHEVDAISLPAAAGGYPSAIKPHRSTTARMPEPLPPTSKVPPGISGVIPTSAPTESHMGRTIAIVVFALALLAVIGWFLIHR